MNADELIALNEEIAGMARAGLPLDQGLAALAKEMSRGRLRSVTTALAADLRAGHTLPQALQRQAGRVPPFYAGLVAAGVRTGRIGDVLATLTTYARTVATLRATIVDALFYPSVVLLFGVALLTFMCVFILPQFATIFRDFGFPLPLATRAVLSLGEAPVEHVLIPLAALALLAVVLKVALSFTTPGRLLWARFLYSVPVIGT